MTAYFGDKSLRRLYTQCLTASFVQPFPITHSKDEGEIVFAWLQYLSRLERSYAW